MNSNRAERILSLYTTGQPLVEELTQRSFLSEEIKKYYLIDYRKRLKSLNS